MGRRTSAGRAVDREKNWDKVFNALMTMCKNLQKERDILADRIKYLKGIVYKMKMEQKVEFLKAEFMLGLKEREAFVYKKRYENTDDELADYCEWFEHLSQKCLAPTSTSDAASVKRGGGQNNSLKYEVRKLKTDIEKCNSVKKSEISALVSEKTFVWNQFKTMENDLTQRLREKDDEVKCANEKAVVLLERLEELQLANERLRTDFAKIESESNQKSQDISRLLKENELLKSRSESRTPLLRPCRGGNGLSRTTASNSISGQSFITMKKELDPSSTCQEMGRVRPSAHKSTGGKAPRKQLCVKGSRSSSRLNRRADEEVITISDMPKLFNSSFKVPKLKRPRSK